MGLDARQQFKFAFLADCADKGLSLAETRQRATQALATLQTKTAAQVKTADPLPGAETAGKLVGTGWEAVKSILGLGMGGAVLGGAGAGWGLAKLQEQDVDPEEAKNQELIAAYQQMADRARRNVQLRRYRDVAPKPKRLF